MRNFKILTLMVTLVCYLFLTQSAQAQNTLTYSTVDYDDATNTVYGYVYTEPDYSAGLYYNQTYVGATIYDANNTVIATIPNHQAYGRSEISMQGAATGYPPYRIVSGHMLFMTYYVSYY
jgi:hypothetical protein